MMTIRLHKIRIPLIYHPFGLLLYFFAVSAGQRQKIHLEENAFVFEMPKPFVAMIIKVRVALNMCQYRAVAFRLHFKNCLVCNLMQRIKGKLEEYKTVTKSKEVPVFDQFQEKLIAVVFGEIGRACVGKECRVER